MALPSVTEFTTAYLDVSFLDKNNARQSPVSLTYRIDCVTTGQEIQTFTSLTPAGLVTITLTASNNALINQSHSRERKRVSVTATYGINDTLIDQYDYWVLNQQAVT